MNKRGWLEYRCGTCGRTFFTKLPKDDGLVNCGWRECAGDGQGFLMLPKRKRMLYPYQIEVSMRDYFSTVGFDAVEALNIVDSVGQTDLIIAGVQVLDRVIHLGHQASSSKIFIAQPCVRMKFQAQVGVQEGISTSFVNVCTEQVGVELEEHLASIDLWLTVLSRIGLHMNHLNIVVRTSRKNWGTGDFESLELFFVYEGLELGDATFSLIPRPNCAAISVSDIGFGLERITWAVNKTESYFDNLTPFIVYSSREVLDACRTLALLSLCGVKATNKGPGLQLRRLAKLLSTGYSKPCVLDYLEYYFAYWMQFIEPRVPRGDAIASVQLEIERQINLAICNRLKLPPPKKETTDEYFNRLVYNYGMNIHELRKAAQECTL